MTLALLIVAGFTITAGGWLCATALVAPAPSLLRMVERIHRPPVALHDRVDGVGSRLLFFLGNWLSAAKTRRQLDLADRAPETHATYIAGAALAGFLMPVVLGLIVTVVVGAANAWIVSLAAGLVCGALGVVLVVVDLGQRAEEASRDLRHQLSAYLDVLTMLLAANQGNEGALRLAAEAGDGRLFVELRRRMLEAATAGRPAVSALGRLGRDLGLVELVEIAASASLATSQGAPVARSLVAKTDSLRSALQAEQEQDARVRTGKITFPLVAMGMVFIIVGLYPALATINRT